MPKSKWFISPYSLPNITVVVPILASIAAPPTVNGLNSISTAEVPPRKKNGRSSFLVLPLTLMFDSLCSTPSVKKQFSLPKRLSPTRLARQSETRLPSIRQSALRRW